MRLLLPRQGEKDFCQSKGSEDYRTSECSSYLQQPDALRRLLGVSARMAREQFNVIRGNAYVTINVTMFRIYQDPVESTTCYGPCLVAAR